MAATASGYRSGMNGQEGVDPSGQLEIFDDLEGSLVCRVCGALVPADERYTRIHWDWHEASNGA